MKYECYWYIGSSKDYEWIFEVMQLTDKTCKLKQIKKWTFDFVSRFMKDKEKREITFRSNWNMKEFITDSFVKYDTYSWTPFIFELIN